MRTRRWIVWLCGAFLCIGCGETQDNVEDVVEDKDVAVQVDIGDTVQADIGDTVPDLPLGPNMVVCPLETKVGVWELSSWETDGYGAVTGSVAGGVNPQNILQPYEEEGACKLLRKENPFCDPPCEGGQVCTHEETCIEYPTNQSVGQVLISGLLTETLPFELKMDPTNNYWDTLVPYPLFAPDSEIVLTASGDTFEGFTLRATGVSQLEVPDRYWTMEEGKDLALSWTSTVGPGEIYLTINVDQHGNSPVTMTCRVEDTGSFSVPSSLVDLLLNYGVSGFATANIFRRTVDSVEIEPGCVELLAFSHVRGMLDVAGHTACFSDDDCTDGQTCDFLIQTCVDSS